MKNLSILDWSALFLLAIGGINWGLISLFDFNLVTALVGDMTVLARVVYGLVGISAIYLPISLLATTSQQASYPNTNRNVVA